MAPASAEPVCTVMVTANTAARARMAPAMKARIRVSRVDMWTLDSPASTILVTNSAGTMYDINEFPCVYFEGRSAQSDFHGVAVQPRGPDAQPLLRIFQTGAVVQTEVLLVERRSHHRLALEGADNPATDDIGA